MRDAASEHRDRGPASSSFGYSSAPPPSSTFRSAASPAFRGSGSSPFGEFGKDAGAPAPAPSGLGSATPAVTWSGLSFSATATYSPCTDCKDGLEAIQVAWAAGGPSKVGKFTTVFPPLSTSYDSFVDGGLNSPGGATYSGNHPYYIGRSSLPASYGYNPAMGSAGSVSGCTVNPTDTPTAAGAWKEAYFETVMVCLNYQSKGKDKLMDSVRWGFTDFGKVHRAGPTDASTTAQVASAPTSDFKATLAADYPSYSFV
jgi:hypothetical protein